MVQPKRPDFDTTPNTPEDRSRTGFNEGYVRGRESENAASSGLLIGLLLALLAGVGGLTWYLIDNSRTTTPERVIVVPSPTTSPSTSPSAQPRINITVPTPVLPSPVAPAQPQPPAQLPIPSPVTPPKPSPSISPSPESPAP
jgi:hypothetical protein